MSKVMTLMNELIDLISMGPFGSDIKVDNFISDGVPVLNGSNVSSIKLTETSFKYISSEKAKALKKANAKRGDIVITHRGTVGQISYIPEDSKYDNYVISQSQFRVSLKRDLVDPIYFTYYFHTDEGQKRLLSFKSHVGVPALAQATTNFRLLEFPLIPLNEQQKTAKVLSDLDAKIELNNRINTELESMAKTLYDYWFVQFDFPDANGKPYKTSGGEMVWNDELKREIPEGWEVEKVSDSSNIVDCLHSKKSDYNFVDEKIYLLQLENIKDDGLIDLSKKYYVTIEDYKKWTSRIEVKDDDIIITNAGRVAATAQIPNNVIAGIGRNITAIRPVSISPTFLFVAFQCSEMKRQITINTDSGTFFKSLNVKGIKELLIARPSKNIEEKFENIAFPMRRKREYNQIQNQELAALRDWLLPMLMNGQVSVGEVEEELRMVAEEREKYGKYETKR
jgi:type I restriction enzyme S subunit